MPAASAIELSPDHAGQYLILPFALATERYDTLVQVNNSMDRFSPRALKLRVLDRDGAQQRANNGSAFMPFNFSLPPKEHL